MSPLLDVQHLTKRIGELLLFEDISFSVAEGQHVGLIARNGAGKSTLLNIITGHEDYDGGEVVFRRDVQVGYLEQTPHFDPNATALEACLSRKERRFSLVADYERCLQQPGNPGLDLLMEEMERLNAWNLEQEVKRVLTKLDIMDYDRPVSQLSGGQLKRVALANVLLSQPDLFILDEPTNHLDLEMIEWLEGELKHNRKGLLMVTHDRYFLDRVCSVILELDDQQIYTYKGNYEYYLEKREERLENMNAALAKANNLYRKELDWMRRMPCARGTKARYRKDAFYELQDIVKKRIAERSMRLEMKGTYIGSKIFEAQYVSKVFDTSTGEKKVILKDFNYIFSRYEKLGIVGGNGTGKSTFIKLLLGLLKPDSGRFVVGETVRFGYYSQEGMAFDQKMKVIDAVRRIAETVDLGGGRRLTAMQFLNHFLFTPARQQDYIYKLSGGERRRLYLCTVLMQNPNFLILDEPTNDLDIPTLQVLEEYLTDFKGCVLVVSHDRYFMDRIVDHLLVFKGQGEIDDFPGNYSQYREWESLQEAIQEPAPKPQRPTEKPERHSQQDRPRKMTFKEKNEFAALEKEIAEMEATKSRMEADMSSGTMSGVEIAEASRKFSQLVKELDEKSTRWLELSELL